MTPVAHYDSVDEQANILLDLPFREGVGIVTQDVAKPHHPMVMVNTPTWAAEGSGLGVLQLDGLTEYLECDAADCADLDFTSEDYSIGGWLNWTVEEFSQIVIARYELSVSGWEVYLTNAAGLNYLSLRHHHAGGATTRTGAFSTGWTPGTNWFFGITRQGPVATMYRGTPGGALVAVPTTSDVLIDPETSNQDLVIGTRYTKNANFFKNMLGRPRAWSPALTPAQWGQVFGKEAGWF